jgi:hypothetical protein
VICRTGFLHHDHVSTDFQGVFFSQDNYLCQLLTVSTSFSAYGIGGSNSENNSPVINKKYSISLWENMICWLTCLLAYAITWCPSSVSRARFVAAGAIDPKFCAYVPLGKSNSQTKFRSSLILGLATRGQHQKHKKCCDSWTNSWIISKFLSWVYFPSFLFYLLLKVTEVKVQNGTVFGTIRYYLI